MACAVPPDLDVTHIDPGTWVSAMYTRFGGSAARAVATRCGLAGNGHMIDQSNWLFTFW